MSIFSDSFDSSESEGYISDFFPGKVHYFGRSIFTLAPIYVDQDFRIVFNSNGALSRPESFLACIDYYLKNILHLKWTGFSPPDISLYNILAVQSWYPSYGHIHDELYILESYNEKHKHSNACILDYHLDARFIKDIDPSYNYIEMHYSILRMHGINMHMRPKASAHISGLRLVRNSIHEACFHSFPVEVSARVMNIPPLFSAFGFSGIQGAQAPLPLLISRQGGARSHRLISNMNAIEQDLQQFGFNVVFPEKLGFLELVLLISRAPKIVLTWGSAMTNLAYAQNGASILVLKSKSYETEDLFLFEKIIKSRNLRLSILSTSEDNTIDLARLRQLI